MLLLLTAPQVVENEGDLLNRLFGAGLEVLHLRKPTLSSQGYAALLQQVDTRYHARIVPHQYHEKLCADFSLRGVHFREAKRIDLGENLAAVVGQYQAAGLSVSSSFHTLEDLADCTTPFDYRLLGPVFTSISKEGYRGRCFPVKHLPGMTVGVGGMEAHRLKTARELGYRGFALLGSVWNAVDPVAQFRQIQSVYNRTR